MTKARGGGGAGKGGRRRSSLLTDDDATIWEHTAQSLDPLRKGKARVHSAVSDDELAPFFVPSEASAHKTSGRASEHPRDEAASRSDTKLTPARKTPELQAFDAKQARRLKRGRTDIEARLDLHGMVQSEAHASLRRFLKSCQANGLRTVLVITGKGGTGGVQRRGGDTDLWGRGVELGILKRNVPLWLAEPELRRMVVSYTDAAIQHGGQGAIYVHIRSATKTVGD